MSPEHVKEATAQSVLSRQVAHLPLTQKGLPLQSPSERHSPHVLVAVLQYGVVPGHCPFEVHPQHAPVTVLQTGVVPEQSVSAEQTAWHTSLLQLQPDPHDTPALHS